MKIVRGTQQDGVSSSLWRSVSHHTRTGRATKPPKQAGQRHSNQPTSASAHQTHSLKSRPCPGGRHSQEAEQWLERTTSASSLAVVAVEVTRAVAVHARHEARRRVPHRLFGKRWGWASVPTLAIKHTCRPGHAPRTRSCSSCKRAHMPSDTKRHENAAPALPPPGGCLCAQRQGVSGRVGRDTEVGDLRRRSRGPSPGRQRRQAACGQRGRAGGLSRKASAHARTHADRKQDAERDSQTAQGGAMRQRVSLALTPAPACFSRRIARRTAAEPRSACAIHLHHMA